MSTSDRISAIDRLAVVRMMPDRYLREAAMAMTSAKIELGKRIRQARDEAHLKQKHLAGRLNVEPATVSRWERGEHAPDLDMLELLAEVTQKPIVYFVGEPDATPDSELRALREEVAEQGEAIRRMTDLVEQFVATAPKRRAPRRTPEDHSKEGQAP